MVGKTLLPILIIAAICLLSGVAMADYVLGLDGFPGITQVDCGRTCGAACCQMCTKWISTSYWNSNQETVYSYCHSHNMESWSIDPQGEGYGLWNYTPPGYYYDDWRYDYNTGAIRGTCLTIDNYKEGVPVVIRSAAHWVVERGYTGSRSILGNYYYNGTVVYGLYINDPLYPSCGGYVGGWKWWCSASTWANSYFNNIPSGSFWGGHRASAERDVLANLHTHQHNGDSFSYY